MLPKKHARFGERDGGNPLAKSRKGAPVPTPRQPAASPEDLRLTENLMEAGKLLSIELLDHIIIGKGGMYASLKEKGLGF